MNQLAQDLRAAKALIDTPEKWIQVHPGKHCGTGRCQCVSTAIASAMAIYDYQHERFRKAIAALGFKDEREVWAWNDAIDRTHPEVVARFDKAIAAAEAQP